MKSFRILFTAVLLTIGLSAIAQKPAAKPAQKFKPPKLTTMLGEYKDSTSISPEKAAEIIALPLKIYDAKKKEYQVSSYQLAFKKAGVTEDEATGKTSPTSTVSAQLFTKTPVSLIWIKTIQAQIKAGDELWFFAVIAKDDKGRVMYSSDLKLTIR
ncbi:MAG: hypothetical protein WAT19_16850 [Ferruginibacter sp.]